MNLSNNYLFIPKRSVYWTKTNFGSFNFFEIFKRCFRTSNEDEQYSQLETRVQTIRNGLEEPARGLSIRISIQSRSLWFFLIFKKHAIALTIGSKLDKFFINRLQIWDKTWVMEYIVRRVDALLSWNKTGPSWSLKQSFEAKRNFSWFVCPHILHCSGWRSRNMYVTILRNI